MPVLLKKYILITVLHATIFLSTEHANVLTGEPTIGMCYLIR